MSDSKDFVITRELDAPRELVWKALTEPQRLAEWWGPKGFTWLRGTVDLKPGGRFHYGMKSPDGKSEMWGLFVYKEIEPPSKLVFINSFSDEAGNIAKAPFPIDWPLEVQNTWALEERAGKTTLTLRGHPVNATEAQHATFESMHGSMQQGFGGTLDQLADYLARA